jgi:hypothetical protein
MASDSVTPTTAGAPIAATTQVSNQLVTNLSHIDPPQNLADAQNSTEATAWVIAQLQKSPFKQVAEWLDGAKVRQEEVGIYKIIFESSLIRLETVRRHFKPKQIWKNGELRQAPVRVDTQPRAKSFALLIFARRHDRETLCKQCASSKSHGPNESCIQPAVEYGKGACTNCIYSGRGIECSLRLGMSQQKRASFIFGG